MNDNIKDLLEKNGEEFKEEILELIKEVPKLMDESHTYDSLAILKLSANNDSLAKFFQNESSYYLALGYIIAKKRHHSNFWQVVLGQ